MTAVFFSLKNFNRSCGICIGEDESSAARGRRLVDDIVSVYVNTVFTKIVRPLYGGSYRALLWKIIFVVNGRRAQRNNAARELIPPPIVLLYWQFLLRRMSELPVKTCELSTTIMAAIQEMFFCLQVIYVRLLSRLLTIQEP